MLVDRILKAYESLGASRGSGRTSSAFLLSRGQDREGDHILGLEAAFELFDDRAGSPAGDGPSGILAEPAKWRVKPRAAPEAGFAPAQPVAAARHLVVTDDDDFADDHAEQPPLPEPRPEGAAPRGPINRSRLAIPLVGGLAALAALLSAPLLLEQAPEEPRTESREGPAAALERSPRAEGLYPPLPPPPAAAPAPAKESAMTAAAGTAGVNPAQPRATVQFAAPMAAAAGPGSRDPAPSRPPPATIPVSLASAAPAPSPQPPVATAPPPQPQAAPMPLATPARWIRGGLQDSDNRKGRFEGVVGVSLTVRADGRVGGCRVTRSSGNPGLDDTTCRLAGQRLQFSPARDAAGRPVESEVSTTYTWGRRVRR